MERLGYGYGVLENKYPRLIYAAVSGFGHTGPYARRPAYDMIAQAMGGVMSLTGHAGGPPTRVGTSTGDITAALFATIGVATALYDRERTGRGQKVDVSMLDSQVGVLENAISRYVATGESPGKLGNRHPSIAPFAAFATQDGHIALAAGNDELFVRIARVLGREDWPRDPRFATNPERVRHVDTLTAEIETVLRRKPSREWLTMLQAAEVPSGPTQRRRRAVMRDPQVLARNMIVESLDPDLGPSACRAIRSSSARTKTRRRARQRRSSMRTGKRSEGIGYSLNSIYCVFNGDCMEILVIAVLIGLIPAAIASSKGHNFFLWVVVRRGDFIVALPHSLMISEGGAKRKCPFCAETRPRGSNRMPSRQRDLPPPVKQRRAILIPCNCFDGVHTGSTIVSCFQN